MFNSGFGTIAKFQRNTNKLTTFWIDADDFYCIFRRKYKIQRTLLF